MVRHVVSLQLPLKQLVRRRQAAVVFHWSRSLPRERRLPGISSFLWRAVGGVWLVGARADGTLSPQKVTLLPMILKLVILSLRTAEGERSLGRTPAFGGGGLQRVGFVRVVGAWTRLVALFSSVESELLSHTHHVDVLAFL